MDKKYCVVLFGLVKGEEDFKSGMAELGLPPAVADEMIQGTPAVLRNNMTLGEARQYADAVQEAGGRVNIQDDGVFAEPKRFEKKSDIKSLGRFTMCPECGHKQLKGKACVKCGFFLQDA